ncbi:transglycosylase domain-containing protein [Bacillus sp. Marseille-P3661]|uniref:transglycosylase domain-containing protein n=1 Tax=Bacillus sp. Marseille-P3661 TaxID=1936234 RepID=UPI000C82B27C|nr:transglycosylase domain-containing protein [Bacillus sp. Marseille-P3661]
MSVKKDKFLKVARISSKVTWNLSIIFITFGLIGLSFAGAVGAGYFASLVKDEPIRSHESMRKDIYNYEETTELYFKDNIYLGKLRSDLDREETKLSEVSEYVKNAVIATEDEYFYEHAGVVPKAILRAILQEFTNSSVKSGGSTLTQQLIKNQILTNEVSFDRKAKEIMIALRLEQFFEKDEILEAYLNVVPFGRNASGRNIAGIQTAAQGIFGVDAKDLNLPQAAYIAGLPQSPFGYTPFKARTGELKEDITPGLNRMKTVLNRMLTAGYITQAEHDEALKYDIKANFAKPKPNPVQNYPWLTFEIEDRAKDIILKILAKEDGYTEEDLKNDENLYNEYYMKADKNLRQNGYRIYSTIDQGIYDKMQEIKNNYQYYGNDKPESVKDPDTGEMVKVMEPVEVGGILIDNDTGAIISFIGGRDHETEQLNHATSGLRSNGSTMKPLLVYAPAIELGKLHPGSVIPDVPLKLKAGPDMWEPENYGEGYHGLVSARYALAKSYNIPTAKVYSTIINNDPTQYLEKMGFSSLTDGDKSHLSMALGALDRGVTVEENVNAFATFANSGKFIDAYLIERIETKDGELIYQHETNPVDVFTPQTAYLTIDMMRDVISEGTAAGIPSKLKFKSDWAGKTGTSQDYRDSWFVATNPNVTFGLWMGYDTPKPIEKSYKGYSYSQRNQNLWAELMNAVYDLKPEIVQTDQRFEMPGGIVQRSYCAVSGLLPSSICEEAGLIQTDLFNAKFVPKEVDNSLIKGSYVTIDGKHYQVPDGFPEEFASKGFMLNPEYLASNGLDSLENVRQLIPNRPAWSNIIVPEKDGFAGMTTDNSKKPDSVKNVILNNNVLSWEQHPGTDIIGYRVYRAEHIDQPYKLVATIPKSANLAYTVTNPNYLFYVTAVNSVGNESPPSNKVSIIDWENGSEYLPIPIGDGQSGTPVEPTNPNNEDNKTGTTPVDSKKPKDPIPNPLENLN